MQRTCRQCGSTFEITDEDLTFYDKVSPVFNGKKEPVPPPSLCPDCRQQQRLAFRNLRTLYRNTCVLTGVALITNVSPDKPYPVYTREAWVGDGWDAQEYAQDISETESFLSQVDILFQSVPRWGNFIEKCENCDFCMNSYEGKDSYLVLSSGEFEKCLYAQRVGKAYECVDCLNLARGELSYECTDNEDLHTCTHMQTCKQCRRCDYCLDCSSCDNCLLCVGLRRRQYCIENEQLTKEAFEKKREELLKERTLLSEKLRQLSEHIPHIAVHNISCENISGDALSHCKDVTHAFYVSNSEDSAYVYDSDHVTISMDVSDADYYTQCYETASAAWMNNCAFCENSIYLTDCYYCSTCTNCDHCFGCIGLKRKQYCILNKQYTKEEYEALVPKIIEKMQKDAGWGEFFPVQLSPFAYNETVAQEYFPLAKEEVIARGWKWKEQTDESPKVAKVIPGSQLPDSIDVIPDDILTWAIRCEATGRPFKIIKQELEFYRQMKLPVPRLHPDERHRRRMTLRNPRKLWKRQCMKCGKNMETSYAPDRPEIVYCEECYLNTVY